MGEGSLTQRQDEEKGEPAEHEDAHDNGQRLGRLLLARELEQTDRQGAAQRATLGAAHPPVGLS